MDKNTNMIKFVLKERYITLTVIGSIFTFAFISSLKNDIVDPLLRFILPEDNFSFMDLPIREGEKIIMPQRQIEIRFGNFFREFITWLFALSTLYCLSIFTRFPDTPHGNILGAAII